MSWCCCFVFPFDEYSPDMTEESAMEIISNKKNEEEEKKGFSLLPNFEDLTLKQWNAVRNALALSPIDTNQKLTGETSDEDESSSSPSIDYFEDDEETLAEEQLDRFVRNGRPKKSREADRLQTVDLVDRPDIHDRPSERQNDGLVGDDQTVDRDVEDGRLSPRQKVSDPEQLQTVDPVDRSTDGDRPSSFQQAVENLGRDRREKRPNVRLADYVTHVAGS
ncbi:unnamed protein product [Cuscuta campestris]|uniref:Uncharacterized protein n=1 Tax=Cuscuta campestris TaxID=132261 RepID=A0A484LW69_9ASTE|nr:unnamed protein product [Cuscuta campestris]